MWPFTRRKRRQEERAIVPWMSGVHPTRDPWGALADATPISPQMAENLSAVIGCVSAISGTISSLPCWTTRNDPGRSEVVDHPLMRLIEFGPSPNETFADFLESLLSSCLLRGNGLAEVLTDQRGRLTGLRTLPWSNITPWIDDAGSLMFDFLPTTPPNAGKRRRYLRDDVLFLKDRSDTGVLGVSRLSRAAGAVRAAIDQQTFASVFLQNSSRPSGVLQSKINLSDDMKRKTKEEWDVAYRGRELGKIAVLPTGLEYQTLAQFSAEDQQLIGLKNLTVAEISRIYSVPPWLLSDPSRSTFASATAAMRAFTMTTLLPWTKKIEAAFAQSVLSSGYRLHIDIDSLLRADIGELYSALLKARQGGWLTANDARSETGFPAVAGGDDLAPPVSGGKPAGDDAGSPSASPGEPASPSEDEDESGKIAPFALRKSRGGAHGD